ncbi:MAG: transporter substrate-binding domain-containing protein [Pseudomonadota bacterium]
MKDATTITTLFPGKLTVCTYGGFAPVCYKDENKKLTGLDVFSLENFVDGLKPKLQIVLIERDFKDLWTLPGEDVCDIAAAGIQRRANRLVGDCASWSDSYFHVKRSLLVRSADQDAFNNYETLVGKTIIVTRDSTADIDAQKRYAELNKILYVDQVAKGQPDAQAYIVEKWIGEHKADAFAEGDVSNSYLANEYGKYVAGGLALADIHDIEGPNESFNFVTRNASSGLLEQLNIFIKDNKGRYPLGRKNIQIS